MKKFILAIAAMAFILVSCNSGSSNKSADNSQKSEQQHGTATHEQHDEHAMLGVKGKCDMCKTRIEKAATDVKGVSSANWDSEKQELHLNFDPHQTSLDAISKAVAKAGHDTDKDKADQATYDSLPDCCKYRK